MISTALSTTTPTTPGNRAAVHARLAAREEDIRLLEEENRWLKTRLFGPALQKTVLVDGYPDQAWLFNEAEGGGRRHPAACRSAG